MGIKLDCRYFKGDKPCKYNGLCSGCEYYQPIGKKILIIKLASIGDVLRTTPLLRGLKEKYPDSYIVWLTSQFSLDVLRGNNFIDEILTYNLKSTLRLQVEFFDVVISLDKAIEATALASKVRAKERLGYGLSKEGRAFPFNKEAEYAFNLGLSDELKFKTNKKSYQEIIFDTVGLKFKNQEYILELNDEQRQFSEDFLKKNRLNSDDFKVGLNTGCGSIFPYKKWTIDGFVELTNKLVRGQMTGLIPISCNKTKVLLLGGKQEIERNREILKKVDVPIVGTGCYHNLKEFIALINCCDLIVSGDTLAMHIAIGLKKMVVALFGPTCAQEVELYGRGESRISLLDCAPCYKNSCNRNKNCMEMITPQEVLEAIYKLKNRNVYEKQ